MSIGRIRTEGDLKRWVERHARPSLSPVLQGEGSPEGVVAAPVGTLFLRVDGGPNSTLYVKESGDGDTGWVAK